ncbi:MAG TPA: GNAT family protein, partial [Coriobacteriia bacterium]|nr:GNAT family protein [Coriobacteriia bacterium]
NRFMLSGHVPLTLGEEMAFYDRSESSDSTHNFEIHVADDMRLIGHAGLIGVDLRHRHGEVGIMVGDVGSQNQGFGRDAIVTLLRFAFDTLGLNSATIRAREDNDRGIHLYRSVGFRPAGVFRQAEYAEGRFFDETLFDLLAEEFRSMYAT